MHPSSLTGEQLRALRERAGNGSLSPVAQVRLECILHFLDNGQSVAETCERFGISRGTLQRWIERFDPADLQKLEKRGGSEARRGSIVAPQVAALIRSYREATPMIGKETIALLLARDHGVSLSPSTVGRVIERECLFFGDTPLHWRKRIRAQANAPRPALLPAAPGPAPAPETPRHEAAAPHARADGDCCLFCRLRRYWPSVRRSFLVVSVVANIVFLTAFALSAWVELKTHGARELRASLNVPSASAR